MASIQKIGASWRALIRRKGHKSICKTFPKKAEAIEWARGIEAQIDNKQPVAHAGLTLAKAIEKFRELRETSRPILDTSNEHYTLNRLEECLGDIEIAKLSVDDLVGFCTKRKDEGAGPYTINMDISKLGTVLRYTAHPLGFQLVDVVGASRPTLSYYGLIGGGGRRERRPTEDELVKVVAYLLENNGQKYADAVIFSSVSAMRRGEVTEILWKDVDEGSQLVGCWRKHPRKTKVWEMVPVIGEAWETLQRQPKTDGRIFPIHKQTLSKYFKAACDELGIPDLHLHDLRHEGTSRLFENGYLIHEVALFTGHKDWKNLKRYTNLRPEHLTKRATGKRQDTQPDPDNLQTASDSRDTSE
jgi:integrase